MDRIETYRNIIKRIIQEVADFAPAEEGIRTEIVFDDINGHYQLLKVGWKNRRRINGTLVHIDIHDDKIWVEHDGTDLEIVQDLLDAGISSKEIVLGFHPPYQRKYTEFAVA